MAFRIPDKLARRSPGKIPNVFSGETPGRSLSTAFALVVQRLIRSDDVNRSRSALRLLKPVTLFTGQHITGILQFTRCRHDMISRHGHGHFVISEFQRKFARAKKLLVSPTFIIRVGN